MPQAYGEPHFRVPKSRVMRFATKLQRLCADRKMSQADVRRAIGDAASASIVSDWFRGTRKPSLDAALLLARAFDVDLNWLADDEQEMPPRTASAGTCDLCEQDREVLRIAKLLGHERAMNRMLGIPSVGDFGPIP